MTWERRPVVTTIGCLMWDETLQEWRRLPDYVGYDDGSAELVPDDFPHHLDPDLS